LRVRIQLPYRELDAAVGLTETGADTLADARTGKNNTNVGPEVERTMSRELDDASVSARWRATPSSTHARMVAMRWSYSIFVKILIVAGVIQISATSGRNQMAHDPSLPNAKN
jgi:hypothetical protein